MGRNREQLWLLALAGTLAVALAPSGCSVGGGGEQALQAETAAETGVTEPAAADRIRVGLVAHVGGLEGRRLESLATKGLREAMSQLGVEGRVLESKSDADYIPKLSTLAEEGFDLVISVGSLMTDATAQVAQEFPDTSFAIIDSAFDPAIPNAQGLLFREQETGCLAGVVAALMSKSGTISAVGGEKIPLVDRFIGGYRFCARRVRPDVELLSGYSDTFVDRSRCERIALGQIAAGSDVVFQVAGPCGLGALATAKEQGVWGIGSGTDQSFLGPAVLTSALRRLDVAVFKTIEAVQSGTFEGGGVTVFGLVEDGVGLGTVSPKVPQRVLDKVEEFRLRIVRGELRVPEEGE